jgi:hypothetical protein
VIDNKSLHIVCFDVPYPVSHGGFFDLFYKLKWLHQAQVIIYLHCFQYGRGQQPELNKYCKEVNYYNRKKYKAFSFRLPYIVSSRINTELFNRLSEDEYPVLLEGTHCTYLLYKDLFPQRNILYRLHNIEHVYYHHLFKYERSWARKLYFFFESLLLENYERKVASGASVVLPVSQNDSNKLKEYCPDANIQYLPLLVPFQEIKSLVGRGKYLLYHGNLSIAENQQAVYWLLKALAPLDMPLILAGKNPPKKLQQFIRKFKNCELRINPTDSELEALIQEAHINIIISFNNTGIKLKLIHALFAGRHCIANSAAVSNEQFENCCHITNTAYEIKERIFYLKNLSFSQTDIELRKSVLLPHFDNNINAQKLSALL